MHNSISLLVRYRCRNIYLTPHESKVPIQIADAHRPDDIAPRPAAKLPTKHNDKHAGCYLRSSMLKPCKKLRPPAHHLRKIARPAGTSAGAKGSFAGSARHQRSRISASSWTFAVVGNNLRGEPDFHGEHEPPRQAEAPRRAGPSQSSITTTAARRTSATS